MIPQWGILNTVNIMAFVQRASEARGTEQERVPRLSESWRYSIPWFGKLVVLHSRHAGRQSPQKLPLKFVQWSQYLTFFSEYKPGDRGLYGSRSPAVMERLWVLAVTCMDECLPDKSCGLWASKIRAAPRRRKKERKSLANSLQMYGLPKHTHIHHLITSINTCSHFFGTEIIVEIISLAMPFKLENEMKVKVI